MMMVILLGLRIELGRGQIGDLWIAHWPFVQFVLGPQNQLQNIDHSRTLVALVFGF
jgi:hypothetical protein